MVVIIIGGISGYLGSKISPSFQPTVPLRVNGLTLVDDKGEDLFRLTVYRSPTDGVIEQVPHLGLFAKHGKQVFDLAISADAITEFTLRSPTPFDQSKLSSDPIPTRSGGVHFFLTPTFARIDMGNSEDRLSMISNKTEKMTDPLGGQFTVGGASLELSSQAVPNKLVITPK